MVSVKSYKKEKDMSENKTLNFELVSPEAKLLSTEAWQVSVPGSEGQMGVRPGHTSIVSLAKTGVVKVWAEEGAEPQSIFIAGGFADITAGNLTILAEEAVNVSDLDATALEQEINNLNDELKLEENEQRKNRLADRMKIASEKLKALAA